MTDDTTTTDTAAVVTEPQTDAPEVPAAVDTPPDDGKGGKEAVLADLARERDKRQAAEKKADELAAAQQATLDGIAKALGFKPSDDATDPDKITADLLAAQQKADDNAAALIRYKTAIEKQVPSHLVKFVTGSTQEEVEASIEDVLEAFASGAPRGPKPDPSQGSQGAPASLDAQIAAAEASGNTREAIRLKARKGFSPSTS